MANLYLDLKQKHQEEVNAFPMAFAFNDDQFERGMASLELTSDDTDQVCSIGVGGFIRKADKEVFIEMMNRHEQEMKEAMEADETGDGFIFDMFVYELANHEYGYTREIEDTLDALGLTIDEIEESEPLQYGLKTACRKLIEEDEE